MRCYRLLLLWSLLLLLSDCGAKSSPEAGSVEFFAMDTVMSVRAYASDDAVLSDVPALVGELENELSATKEGSVVYALNHDKRAAMTDDAALLLSRALVRCGDLGGNVQTVGKKPDGSDWRVAVQDPNGDGLLGVLTVSDQAVITSGGYERYFIDETGTLWWHIMDPMSGYPARNGLVSVTVVGDEGLYCDALSTALFVMGTEDTVAFWRAHRDFDILLVTEDGELLLTGALAERFSPAEGLAYPIEVLDDA